MTSKKTLRQNVADDLTTGLGNTLDYASADTSFSPFYSDIGLGIEKQGGIACLFLHYNRKTTRFLTPFLAMPDTLLAQTCTPLCVSQRYAGGTATIAFCAHNTWIVDCNGFEELSFSLAHATELTEVRYKKISAAMHVFDGYLPTIDQRDPDRQFPLVLGIRIVRGKLRRGNGREQPLQMAADNKGRLVVAFSVRMLAVAHAPLVQRLTTASRTAADASVRTHAWLRNAAGTARIAVDNPAEQAVLARALHALLSNSTEAPGLLAGRIAAFPSRGRYPTHFLWDSCFQNLAAAYLHPQLAEDSLLLLTDNLRADGKMPHFICSTWLRPHESQPPLVGWAGLRLVQERNDMPLTARLLPALQRNTQWWLSQRMTRFGLIAAQHGLETGWDDSPRFDKGPTVACDLNSYLLLQMRACAEFSRMLGDKDGAKAQTAEADAYAHRMVAVLYDKDAGLFWDIHLASGEPVTIKTPACFLPLLADVPLPAAAIRRAIKDVLLNPACFFGPVPFPSVAYNEDCYNASQWWRGPTWLPVAYLMLQILDKTGFATQARMARTALYQMIIKDGNLRELFDSQTGAGLGAYQQGWTAALCLRLHAEKEKQ